MARTSEKNREMRETSRERIREAALRQFARKGLSAARIRDIADEAGISQGLLYRYYGSKDEVFTDLIEDALDKLIDAVRRVETLETDAGGKLRLALLELLKTIEKSDRFRQTSRLITLAMHSEAIPEKARHALEEKREIPYRAFAEIMDKGQREGRVVEGDPRDLAVLFWSTVNGMAAYAATRENVRILPLAEHVLSMFLIPEEGGGR